MWQFPLLALFPFAQKFKFEHPGEMGRILWKSGRVTEGGGGGEWFSLAFSPGTSGCPEAVKVLVGNKCDLPADVDLSQAKVSSRKDFLKVFTLYLNCLLQKYADLHDMEFIETSAKTNMNIQEAFFKLASEICEVKAQQVPPTLPGYDNHQSISLPRNTTLVENKSSSGCSC